MCFKKWFHNAVMKSFICLMSTRKFYPDTTIILHIITFVFKGSKYKSPEVDGACAINMNGNPSFHERCFCDSVSQTDCRNMCNGDQLCKGYAKRKGTSQCQIATNSTCPPGCQKASAGNVGNLIVDSSFSKSFYGGCFIKGTWWLNWQLYLLRYDQTSHMVIIKPLIILRWRMFMQRPCWWIGQWKL